jgi:hypothetical protein
MDERWSSLVEGARAMMAERQESTFTKFGLDYSMQYKWDTARAEMVFSSRGVPIVLAEFQFVGSISGVEPNWLWGWANGSLSKVATNRLAEVRRFGEEQGFWKLTEPTWSPEEDDGDALMMVSAAILDSPAFFHCHLPNQALFFVLYGFRHIGE